MLVWTAAAVAFAVPLVAAWYLSHLPDAPHCPACRAVTAERLRPSSLDRWLARLGGADLRTCPRCGWIGRMRWRLAPGRVQGR